MTSVLSAIVLCDLLKPRTSCLSTVDHSVCLFLRPVIVFVSTTKVMRRLAQRPDSERKLEV
jgi:hypothetical protein